MTLSAQPAFSLRRNMAIAGSSFLTIPMIGKDLGYCIYALHRIRSYGCWEDAAVDDVEALGSPNVEILTNYTILRARAHLVCRLHMGGCDDGFV